MAELPRAVAPLVSFAPRLRAAGIAVAPEQTASFVAAVGLLGPRQMGDIHRAALATFAVRPEDRARFDALFRAHFLGQTVAAPASAEDDEETVVSEPEGEDAPIEPEEETLSGGEASVLEALGVRGFAAMDEGEALRRFRRAAPAALPRRRSRRLVARRRGARPDMRRALREAVARDGEVVRLPRLARRTRQRRILLLVDISGSMKGETDRALRFAHTLVHAAERVEVFTVGTRLTRVTRALGRRHPQAALAAAAAAVSDWDGGTRLGDALAAFLVIPRYAGFARSAYVVILSDGLERGDPAALVGAMERLSRLAWSVLWLSPLATGARFEPQTEALRAVAPFLDRIGDASSPAAVTHEILTFARAS
ncbi:VWA domain-containing protein [Acuticoccus mangrovi]|uniref:VWA domain-containing protein n=1 Tax=Acuticoccus mangrovi TaxID=2796142 RepID=A0A934IEK9_9HYPH|nr:VWA domain-containing protein [Acuticoccus mangrovi]MBJ3775174.1 VWA domain-containing protein [Acuticoccus mangrovi]